MSAPADHADPPRSGRSFLAWLGLSVLLVSLLALAAAHVTGRAGIVCRFAPLFGLAGGAAIGGLIAPLAGQGTTAATWRRSLLAGGLVGAGFAGMALESYRLHVERLRAEYLEDPVPALTGALPPHEAQRIADEMRQARRAAFETDSTFRRHLHYRLTGDRAPDDRWAEPWPAVIWSIEILLAALAASAGHHLFARPARTEQGTHASAAN